MRPSHDEIIERADEITRFATGTHPAYGSAYHDTLKTRAVKDDKKSPSPLLVFAGLAVLIWVLFFAFALRAAGAL